MSQGLNLLVIRVDDLGAARAFYEALGLPLQVEKHGSGPEHLSATTGSTVFELYPRRSESDSTSSVRIGFSVPSLASVLASLRAIDAELLSLPKASEWGLRAVVRDPDGHTVELLEAAS